MPEPPETVYDLAVIGGGIAGAAVARDAALRGLSVVVFEKNTVGSGTSSKSSKLIHGGIRYLEMAWNDFKHLHWGTALKNFRFVFLSLRETRILEHTAPDFIQPIRLFVPIYRGRTRGVLSVYAGTLLYGGLSWLAGKRSAPRFFQGKKKALEALPLLRPDDLVGGVEIPDYTTDDLRLVQAIAESAKQSGAIFWEHTGVRLWKYEANQRLYQVKSETDTFYARQIVNATGPWIDKTRGGEIALADRYVYPVGGSHIELPAFLGRSAILEAEDGRLFFVIEKNGRARVGTTEWPGGNPDDVRVPETDIDYLLRALLSHFPTQTWKRSDILGSDAGLRPLAVNRSTSLTIPSLSREHTIQTGPDRVLHLIGVKLTDHRRAAEKTVDCVLRSLGKKGPRSRTAVTPLIVPRPK